MPYSIRGTWYYRLKVADHPEEAYEFLSGLADLGVNLLAFSAVPSGPDHVQLTLFPDDPSKLGALSGRSGMVLEGPHAAILVQGDDELGALADVHRRLVEASVPVYASSGVTDGRGSFGYVIYVQQAHFDQALAALDAHAPGEATRVG